MCIARIHQVIHIFKAAHFDNSDEDDVENLALKVANDYNYELNMILQTGKREK
jgi:hypothetical protein